jgi:hypothetical protein
MTDAEKAEKLEAIAEEVEELSEELSEDELEQVAGGGACDCAASGYGSATDNGGRCTCSALGAGTTIANSSDPDHLRCACSGAGYGADGPGGGGGSTIPDCGELSVAKNIIGGYIGSQK